MKFRLSNLYRSSARDLVGMAAKAIRYRTAFDRRSRNALIGQLRDRFSVYQVQNLVAVDAENFREHVTSRIGTDDAAAEGYSTAELSRQRDLSVRFHWGHDHDFGTFKLDGRMGDRHLRVTANFFSLFPIAADDFAGKAVFDIGCWTGGTTLLLASLGASVYAIEEVRKYADMARYLADAFGLSDRVSVTSESVYDCNRDDMRERFDIVFFPGVVYHLSDPLVALRILYNSLRLDGTILVESSGINSAEPVCRFDGSMIYIAGSAQRKDRSGWNWFLPSPSALHRMLVEAGFEEVEACWHEDRVYAFGRKRQRNPICRAGLSVRGIP